MCPSEPQVELTLPGPPAIRRYEPWVILVALLLPSVVTYLYFVALADSAAGWQYAVYSVGKAVQFLLPVAWIWWVAPDKLRWTPPQAGGWWWAVGFGVAATIGICGLYVGFVRGNPEFGELVAGVCEKLDGLECDRPARFLALAVFYALVHSLLEEYYWRWFVFDRLRGWTPVSWAILISSVGFMAHHVLVLAQLFGSYSLWPWLLAVCVGVGGAFWAWLYQHARSLWPCWFSHAMVDAAIFGVGYLIMFGGG